MSSKQTLLELNTKLIMLKAMLSNIADGEDGQQLASESLDKLHSSLTELRDDLENVVDDVQKAANPRSAKLAADKINRISSIDQLAAQLGKLNKLAAASIHTKPETPMNAGVRSGELSAPAIGNSTPGKQGEATAGRNETISSGLFGPKKNNQ